jgi:hypothetical protein
MIKRQLLSIFIGANGASARRISNGANGAGAKRAGGDND